MIIPIKTTFIKMDMQQLYDDAARRKDLEDFEKALATLEMLIRQLPESERWLDGSVQVGKRADGVGGDDSDEEDESMDGFPAELGHD